MAAQTEINAGVSLYDARPFFEKALQHGIQNHIIDNAKIDAIAADAPKGMVQIARYFGTEFLRPELEKAKDRMVNLVSLYLEHTFDGDVQEAAISLNDHSFLSRSKGGSDMLKAMIAMPQNSHFGMSERGGFTNDHIPQLAKWSLCSLADYQAELAKRQQVALVIDAAVWFANELGLDADDLESFIKGVPENILVVLDEAYYEYMPEDLKPDTDQWLQQYPNLIVTRTFSKIYGLAGLRIGYAISHPDVADVLNCVRQPFNTSLPAQAAALAALDDLGHLGRSVQMNTNGLNQLADGFKHLDLQFITSIGNFVTVDMTRDAAPIYEAMLREGVIIRPLAIYNMKQHLRITVGSREQNDRCLKALEKVLQGKYQK